MWHCAYNFEIVLSSPIYTHLSYDQGHLAKMIDYVQVILFASLSLFTGRDAHNISIYLFYMQSVLYGDMTKGY